MKNKVESSLVVKAVSSEIAKQRAELEINKFYGKNNYIITKVTSSDVYDDIFKLWNVWFAVNE